MSGSIQGTTVVLVHAAWADGSSWAEVIRPLSAQGIKVIAAPIPLTSLSDDVGSSIGRWRGRKGR